MLTWAAAAHFKQLGLDVAVPDPLPHTHTCAARESRGLFPCLFVFVLLANLNKGDVPSYWVLIAGENLDALFLLLASRFFVWPQVHACHPGALATRTLRARGFRDESSGGALLSGRAASR